MNFSGVSNLIDKVVECQARGTSLKSPILYLHVAETSPLRFHDAATISLVVDKSDLQSFLSNKEKIEVGSIVCLQSCQVSLDYGANNDVTNCQVQSKNVTIDFGNEKQKKIKNFTLKVRVNEEGEIPILPSTRRYLRRIQKTEFAKKHLSKTTAKSDPLAFFKADKKSSQKEQTQKESSSSTIVLDTQSQTILKKLLNFVDKQDLMRVAIKHPLRNKDSKKVVRMMAVPNQQTDDDDLTVRKKTYARNTVQQLFREYESREGK